MVLRPQVSLVSAATGAQVVATDIPEIVTEHLIPNLTANKPSLDGLSSSAGSVEARELTWGKTDLGEFGCDWDYVVASDVIYRSEHVPLLLDTLRGVVGPRTVCLVAFDKRGREGVQAFLRAFDEHFELSVRPVEPNEMPPGFRFAHFGCVEIRRRN